MTEEEAFAALGLSPGAPPAVVHRRFRKLSFAAHPDTEGGSAEAFSELRAAYVMASDYAATEPCPTCKGARRKTLPSGGGFVPMTITCPDCEGTGYRHAR